MGFMYYVNIHMMYIMFVIYQTYHISPILFLWKTLTNAVVEASFPLSLWSSKTVPSDATNEN